MTMEKSTHRAVLIELEFEIDIAMTSSIQAIASAITAAPKVTIPGTVVNNKFSFNILAKTGRAVIDIAVPIKIAILK